MCFCLHTGVMQINARTSYQHCKHTNILQQILLLPQPPRHICHHISVHNSLHNSLTCEQMLAVRVTDVAVTLDRNVAVSRTPYAMEKSEGKRLQQQEHGELATCTLTTIQIAWSVRICAIDTMPGGRKVVAERKSRAFLC